MVIKRTTKTNELSLRERGGLVESLWHAVDNAAGNLENVPGLVRGVLKTEAWRCREQDGEIFQHKRFIDFITTKPLAGCGWTPDKVEALIKDDPETLTLWRQAVTPPKAHHNNIMMSKQGTGRSYTLSRLKRQSPELFNRVTKGELSANAAAIEAGFRKKVTPFQQIKRLIPKLSAAERRELKKLL